MELPEAEVVQRQIAALITSSRFVRLSILTPSYWSNPQRIDVIGRSITSVRRAGKMICIRFSQSSDGRTAALACRFGMTGQVRLHQPSDPIETHTHAVMGFEPGPIELRFRDARRFGRLILLGESDLADWLEKSIGKDPLEMTSEEFTSVVASRSAPIKHLLLNQRVVSGIGNIYSDEALFETGIHPRRPAYRLSGVESRRLLNSLQGLMQRAIAAGGSTFSDFVDVYGRPGSFQAHHRVYGRYGKPCQRCGRILRGVRTPSRTYTYCVRCQAWKTG